MIVGGSDITVDRKVDVGIPVPASSDAAPEPVAKPAPSDAIATPEVKPKADPANPYMEIAATESATSEATDLSNNPYGEIAKEDGRIGESMFKIAMKAAQDTNPDQYKKAKDLSERTGIPADVIDRNLTAVERNAPWLTNELDELLKDSPVTAAFLAERDHAKLAKDDIKPLSALEQIARMEENDRWIPSNLGKTFRHGMATMNTNIAQAPAFFHAALYAPQNMIVKAAGRPDQQVPVPDWMINNPVVDYFRRAQKYFDTEEIHQSPVQAIGEGDFKKASRILASQIVDNAPSQIVTLTAAAMGGAAIKAIEIGGKTYKIYAPMLGAAKNNLQAAGLAFMGMLSGSQQTAQDIEAGKDPAQTGMDALTNAIAEAGFENMGTMGILKHWEGAIAKSFGKGTAKQLMQDVGKTLAYSFFGEGAEEFATQFAQDFSDYVTGNPRALDGVVGRAMDAFLIGAGSGISMTSPTAVYSGMVKSQRLNQDIKFWDKFIGAGQESKLRQRDPVAFEAHAERVLKENGKPEKLYIAPDVLQSFFQTDEGLDAKAYNDFLNDMGINDQLAEAAATGKEFEMSAARFAARWAGSDLAQKIAPDIRFSPDGMTAKEQMALKDNLQKNIDEMQREYAQLVEENKVPPQAAAMREKLMLPKDKGGFGMSAENADANMAVFLGRAAVAAKAWGLTTEQWFAKVNPQLNVGGQYIEGSAALTQVDNQEKAKSQVLQKTIAKIKGLYGGKESAINGFLTGNVKPAAISKDPGVKDNLMRIREEMRTEQARIDTRQGELFQADSPVRRKQTESENFKNWFNESKAVDEAGAPEVMFHGTGRPDRVGAEFRRSRATSGPISYFTSDPEVASGYATGKKDTSLSREDGTGLYNEWFKVKVGRGKPVNIDQYWYHIPYEERQKILKLAPQVTSNDNGDLVFEEGATRGNGGYNIEYNRGNALKALVEAWLDSGALFNEEHRFFDVLKLAGVDTKNISYNDPNATYPAVYPVYLSIKNPLDTASIPAEVVTALEDAAKKSRRSNSKYNADLWDKTNRDPQEWVDTLKRDIKDNTTLAWTSVPDFVTTVLKRFGYDGIKDTGGKFHDVRHAVWIPFEPNQIKSAIGNRGTFDPGSRNILKQEGPTPRGSVQFTASGAIINLYQSANLSTFLHESAHIFMNDMKALIDAGVADVQTTKDFQTLVDFVGGDITTRESQEKLARAFEAYLREGKAPSVKLVPAFRRIKQWLVAIYKSIRGLNVEITPEIRDVFDRLIASENEISEANRFYSSKQALVDLIPTTPERKAAVKQLKMDAEETALEKQAKTLLRAYLEATGGRAEIRAQATKDVDSLPVYKALKTALEAGGVDPAPLVQSIGKDAVEALKQRFPGVFKRVSTPKGRTWDQEVRSRGGIDPRTMGEYEVQTFKEMKGGKNVLREGGGHWDDMAASFMEEGLLRVPDNRTPSDYLRELVEQKAKVPEFNPPDPQDRITIPELALQHNYESPEAFLAELQQTDRRSAAITRRTQELMQQKEQDILKDLQGQELVPGEEAVHNDKTMTYLIAEATLLGERLDRAQARRPELLEAKVYKAAAEDVIAKKKVSVAGRYDLYSKAEQKYAKQALTATEQGDFETAFEAKRKQILNHAMVLASVRARDEKLDIEKSFKPKKFKARLNSVENAFAEAAMDLAKTYGLSDIEPKMADAVAALKDHDETLYDMLPEWIQNKKTPDGFNDYRDLSMADLRDLNAAIGSVLAVGSDAMKSIEEGEARTIREWADQSIALMEQLKELKGQKLEQLKDESSKLAKPLIWIEKFAAGATMFQFLTDFADKFTFLKTGKQGPMRRLYNGAMQAEVRFQDLKASVMNATKASWDVLEKAQERITEQNGAFFQIPGLAIPEDLVNSRRKSWTVNRLISIMLNTGNEGNLEVLKRGYGFTDANIQKVASYFTAAELNAIQEIWNATDLLFPALNDTHFSLYNRNVPKVEGTPTRFTSADGSVVELKGGYYPLIFDHQINDKAMQFVEDDMMKNQSKAVIRSVKPSDGMTKERVSGHSLPPLLDISVWFNHINATARYAAYARVLRDLNRVTKDADWKKMFKSRIGNEHYENVRAWLQYNANPGRTAFNNPLDKAAAIGAGWLRSLSTAAILGFKNAVGLKQRASIINAAQAMGGKDLGRGWKWILEGVKNTDYRTSVLGLSRTDAWKEITKKSDYLRIRDGKLDREINDMKKKINPLAKKITILGRTFTTADIQDFSYEWIKMNDRAAVSVIWNGAYNQSLAEHTNEQRTPEEAHKAAVIYADGIIQDSQPSGLVPELSGVQRAESWIRLFTSFMTFTLKYGNRVMQNYRAWSQEQISNKEFFNHVLHEQIAGPWVAMLIGSLALGKLPKWWEWIMEPFSALASWIPFVRDIFSYWKYNKDIGATPLGEPLVRIGKAGMTTAKFMAGDKTLTQALWDVGRAVEIFLKVPALNFVKEMTNAFKNITEG